jgi:hypothetical protein
MWSTPQFRDFRSPDSPDSGNFKRKVEMGYTIDLNSRAAMWPTPTSLSFDASHQPGNNRNQNKTMDLASKMWPTPDAFVSNDGESPETFEARRAKVKAEHNNGNGMGTPLAMACKMWSTPTAQDAANTAGPSQFDRNSQPLNVQASLLAPTTAKAGPTGSQRAVLNPAFVEALMGFPPEWTAFAPSETPSSPKSRRSRLPSSGNGTGSEADGE